MSRPDWPRGELPLSSTARIAVVAMPRPGVPGEIALHVGIECRSVADHSVSAFCPTARGFPVPLHLAEALAQEIVSVARRASESRLWALVETPTGNDAA